MASELIANQIVPPGGMRFDSAALCHIRDEGLPDNSDSISEFCS